MEKKNQNKKIYNYYSEEELQKLMTLTHGDLFIRALAIVGKIYNESLDRSNYLVISHFVRVASLLKTDDEKIVALLHDIDEDEFLTQEDLLFLEFPQHIVDAIKILTRDKTIFPDYVDYVTFVIESNNKLAIRVKYADMLDNFSPRRLERLEESERVRLSHKYKDQLPRIIAKLKELDLDY